MNNTKKIFALGFFDGVHLAHQVLLQACRELAEEHSCVPAAITFDRHPKSLAMSQAPDLISTIRDRQLLLRRYGMEFVELVPVVEQVMSLPWQQFLQRLYRLGAAGFVCGDDFRFGYRGEGTAEKLQQLCKEQGIPCVVISQQSLGQIRVSSTYIRGRIQAGDMTTAIEFLGHPYTLTGIAARDPMPGRLGIPTSILRFPAELVIPRFGVYACRALVDGIWYAAVTNIGVALPQDGEGITVEPWILDFSGDIRGKEITLEFHQFLRPEENFSSREELLREICQNAEQTRTLIQI